MKRNENFLLRGNFATFCSWGRKNCRKTRSIPAVFDNPVSQRLVQAAEVLKCYQPVNCKLDLRFTTLSNGPPASLRILTALNNQSASAPRQNFRHPKTLETTHTTHSLRLSGLLSRAPESVRIELIAVISNCRGRRLTFAKVQSNVHLLKNEDFVGELCNFRFR